MTYLEGLSKVIEDMRGAELDQNAQQTTYLGLIAMQLATMNDELARMNGSVKSEVHCDCTDEEISKSFMEEQKKAAEIKIGDEVTDDDGWNGVVTWIDPDGEYLIILQKDGTALRWKKDIFKKTGRHFSQTEEVLEQMQEGRKDEQ